MAPASLQVTRSYRPQAGLSRALSHPVRLAILDVLRDGEQCVCHMEATLGLRQAYISQHLMVLRDVGLVEDRRDGWNIFYRLRDRDILRVTDALTSIAGRRSPRLTHRHASTPCPCPKCNGTNRKPDAAKSGTRA